MIKSHKDISLVDFFSLPSSNTISVSSKMIYDSRVIPASWNGIILNSKMAKVTIVKYAVLKQQTLSFRINKTGRN